LATPGSHQKLIFVKEPMLDIWQAAVEELKKGRDCVLATILSVRGSSPRHVGTRFLVRWDGRTVGTIGGGLFESQVQELASIALKNRTSCRALFSFSGLDHQSPQMICGGEVDVLLDFVDAQDGDQLVLFSRLLAAARERGAAFLFTCLTVPVGGSVPGALKRLLVDAEGTRTGGFPGDTAAVEAMPEIRLLKPAQVLSVLGLEHPVLLEWLHPAGTVYIFGGGHVGVSVAHVAAFVHFHVVVLDDREEYVSEERFPEADRRIALESFADAFSGLRVDKDSYVVIVTRGHSHDRAILGQALRTDAGYIGMIGSKRKNHLIFQGLLLEGFTREDLQRAHAPIGIPIGGETPEEIAVSIVAEMIQVRDRQEQLKKVGPVPKDRTECGDADR
jgi:xanthine dehydrogenase accessory factor